MAELGQAVRVGRPGRRLRDLLQQPRTDRSWWLQARPDCSWNRAVIGAAERGTRYARGPRCVLGHVDGIADCGGRGDLADRRRQDLQQAESSIAAVSRCTDIAPGDHRERATV